MSNKNGLFVKFFILKSRIHSQHDYENEQQIGEDDYLGEWSKSIAIKIRSLSAIV